MLLRDAIEQSFVYLEQNHNIKYGIKTATKNNLIEAFSQVLVSPSAKLGYKTTNGLSKAMGRLSESISRSKTTNQEWRDWLLANINKYLCKQCYTVFDYNDRYSTQIYICKDCDGDNRLSRYQSTRKKVYEYLLNHPCTDCGEVDPVVLEFDHLDPTIKEYNISNMMSYSWSSIEKEISKCQVVCANCHRRRTAKTYNWYNFK